MAIPISEASATLVNMIVEGHKDNAPATKFLQSFFASKFRPAFGVKFNVKRMGRPIAVDVQRYSSNGEVVKSSYSDQKLFIPPYFENSIMLNEHELYNNVVGMIATMNNGTLSPAQESLLTANLRMFRDDISEQLIDVQNMQYRSIELMCAQALKTGIITLSNADNVDFKRKAASKVDLGSGNYWATSTVNPFTTLETMCRFLRVEGMSGATKFPFLFGVTAWKDLRNNPFYIAQMDSLRSNQGSINPPSRPQEGAEYHGELTVGNYIIEVWTYDQYYDDATSGASTSYLDPKQVIGIAPDANFSIDYCLVPQIVNSDATIDQTAEFLIQQFVDKRSGKDEMVVKCAPIPILKSVDKVCTYKVVA
jgi:hypothetical protein